MKKIVIILFFLFVTSCYDRSILQNINNSNEIEFMSHSRSGTYLSSSYSILLGDVFSANKLLQFETKDKTLLELKFFSNLVSGNFEIANNISKSLNIKDQNDFIYRIPKFIKSIENKEFNKSLKILEQSKDFINFYEINKLLKDWLFLSKKKSEDSLLPNKDIPWNVPIYKLLIFENFYDNKILRQIADFNLNQDLLSNIDLLFLAGYYFRINEKEIFEKLINRLSESFNKEYILYDFGSSHNFFNDKANLKTILSYYLYNMAFKKDDKNEIPSSYIKILLEMSIYFNSNMDISKYSLAELYSSEGSKHIAVRLIDDIEEQSYISLAANLKKLSIFKIFKDKKKYKKLLFELSEKAPQNKIVLYELANFYKLNKNYSKAIKLYKQLMIVEGKNNKLLFLYATCLDKIGNWAESKKILLKIINNDNYDSYALNYLSYKLAVKKINLDFALTLITSALKIEPNNPFFLDTLGWVQFQRKNYNSSVFYLEKAVTIEPNNSEIIDHLGDCYLMLNRIDEAKFEWKKALQYETNKEISSMIKNKIDLHE